MTMYWLCSVCGLEMAYASIQCNLQSGIVLPEALKT